MTAFIIALGLVAAIGALILYLVRAPGIGLVDNWRRWPRMASTWAGAAAWSIIAFFTARPDVLVGIFGALPEGQRIPFAMVVGAGGFALFLIARLARKETPDGPAATD
jgi:hypothetical protein